MKQSSVFLELVLYKIGIQATTSLARTIVCHFRLVDNLLYSFQSRTLLETTGNEIFQLMEQNNMNLQHRYTTSQEHHFDFSQEAETEVILGFTWNKRLDTLMPATVMGDRVLDSRAQC